MILKNLSSKFVQYFFLVLFCSSFINQKIHCMFFDGDDEFDRILNNLSEHDIEQIRACESGEAQLFNSLIRQYHIAETLDAPVYLQTELPRTRNLINFPNFQICTYQDITKTNQFTWHFFYNQTTRKNYTKSENDIDGTKIGSYIDVDCGGPISNFVKVLLQQTIIAQLTPLGGMNFPFIFGAASNIRLEERRMGGLAHWYHAFNDKTYLEIKIPMFWMVKNLQLTQCEKDIIEAEFTAYTGTSFGNFDFDQWARQHIVFDAIGTGTTEISLCSRAMTGSNWHIDAGAFLYLPTDYPWKKGLYGTYIEPSNQFPILDLCDLVDIGTASLDPTASTTMYNYFTAALDQLASAVLQCPLGYYQTFAMGIKLSPYWCPHENLEFHGVYFFEYLFPYEQPRFFIPKNRGDFSSIYNNLPNTTNADAQATLLFFETRLSELLFPRVYNTRLSPGFIIDTISSMHKTWHHWDFALGYNCWAQMNENFLSIDLPRNVNINDLDIDKSIAQDAYMIKIFAKVHKDIKLARHTLSMTLWGDVSVLSNTVGNDFTLGICFDSQF